MAITLTFLGTAGSIPTAKKNPTSILLNYFGENILVDCGEGTQIQFRKAGLNPCKITRILLTHWHGDHTLGLPGLLETLQLSGYSKTLSIYGPRGIKQKLNDMIKLFGIRTEYKIEIKEVSGRFFETADFSLEAEAMTHGTPCNAYSFVVKEKLRIDKDKLKKAGLAEGPHLQKIKEGKNVTIDGKKYFAKNLTYKEKGKKISFVLDTSLNSKIAPFVKDSDIFVCEASFLSDLEEHASQYKHLTAEQAGMIAKKAKIEKLILTHISQRYEHDSESVLNDAKKFFKNVSLVKDLDVVELG